MSARAKRRDDARTAAKIIEKSGAAELDTVGELATARREVDMLKGYCKTYKTRLERLAMALQFVSNRIIENNVQAAQVAMRSILANDLAEARETVGNRAMALEIAIAALDRAMSGMPYSGLEIKEAVMKIKTLAPEHFGGEVAMTAATVGEA